MAAYQLIAAVGTTDADGITTFTNRPPGAPLFYLDDNGGWVPVGEAAPATSQQPGGPTYTAGIGIDLTGNVISTTGYTDAELDAFLAGKAPLNSPALAPFVGYVNGTLVGFETFELACQARPVVLHVRTPTLTLAATTRTFSGVLYANDAEFVVPDGLELRLARNAQVYNANIVTLGTGVVAVIGSGTPTGGSMPAPIECLQLIDCTVGNLRFAINSYQGLLLRGNSTVAQLNSDAIAYANVPVYLFDYSAVTTVYPSFDLLDYRVKPPFAVLSSSTIAFTRHADYGVIASGTFTVDTTGAQAGVVVRVELAAGATAPTLPARFELISGAFVAGARQGYGFSVMATGKIEYFIYQKP